MVEKQFSNWQAIKDSCSQTVEHLGLFLTVTVIQLAFGIALIAGAALWFIFLARTVPLALTVAVITLLSLAFLYTIGWFSLAWTKICLEIEATGASSMDTLWSSMKFESKLWNMLVLTSWFGLVRTIAYILFIIPGLWIDAVYAFSFFYLVEHNVTALQAMRASAKMTQGSRMKLIGFFLALAVIEAIGHVTVIGSLFVAPWVTLAQLWVYRKFSDNRA
jgi:uncharacterized membrane protein